MAYEKMARLVFFVEDTKHREVHTDNGFSYCVFLQTVTDYVHESPFFLGCEHLFLVYSQVLIRYRALYVDIFGDT